MASKPERDITRNPKTGIITERLMSFKHFEKMQKFFHLCLQVYRCQVSVARFDVDHPQECVLRNRLHLRIYDNIHRDLVLVRRQAFAKWSLCAKYKVIFCLRRLNVYEVGKFCDCFAITNANLRIHHRVVGDTSKDIAI